MTKNGHVKLIEGYLLDRCLGMKRERNRRPNSATSQQYPSVLRANNYSDKYFALCIQERSAGTASIMGDRLSFNIGVFVVFEIIPVFSVTTVPAFRDAGKYKTRFLYVCYQLYGPVTPKSIADQIPIEFLKKHSTTPGNPVILNYRSYLRCYRPIIAFGL